jgi:hypothetical protein
MLKSRAVSFRPSWAGHRLFGRFAGYTDDGKVRVYQGLTLHLLDPGEITWEVN